MEKLSFPAIFALAILISAPIAVIGWPLLIVLAILYAYTDDEPTKSTTDQ